NIRLHSYDRLIFLFSLQFFVTSLFFFIFFFNDTATTEIYTLSLHDALPISKAVAYTQKLQLIIIATGMVIAGYMVVHLMPANVGDRKSTRLNSSHLVISYAVFCLKKKKKKKRK